MKKVRIIVVMVVLLSLFVSVSYAASGQLIESQYYKKSSSAPYASLESFDDYLTPEEWKCITADIVRPYSKGGLIGIPHKRKTAGGIDCSAFVSLVLNDYCGLEVGKLTTYKFYNEFKKSEKYTPVNVSAIYSKYKFNRNSYKDLATMLEAGGLRPGAILIYGAGDVPSHIAFYYGNGMTLDTINTALALNESTWYLTTEKNGNLKEDRMFGDGIQVRPFFPNVRNVEGLYSRTGQNSILMGYINMVSEYDYSHVFNHEYYIEKYPDVKKACGSSYIKAFEHFIHHGMKEGRIGSEEFDVSFYRAKYPELEKQFGDNLKQYYIHYIKYGIKEGKTAYNPANRILVTNYRGIDFAPVYDFDYYIENNPDIKEAFGTDKKKALQHFVTHGMQEGRQATENFNVYSYKNRYQDLRLAFGDNLELYYLHYIEYGMAEERITTGFEDKLVNPVRKTKEADYSPIYNFDYYISNYYDLKEVFEMDDVGALQHFITFGMKEGRRASEDFDPVYYRESHKDLEEAFGDDLEKYYLHYLEYGIAENREGKKNEKQ